MKKYLYLIGLLLGGTLLLLASYYLLTEVFFGPTPEVRTALMSSTEVQVDFLEGKSWMVLTPREKNIEAGLLMYPENYQDIRMYAPPLRKIAEAGFQVVMVSRRGKYAFTAEDEAKRIAQVMDHFPAVETWFLGAHSWEATVVAEYLPKADPRIQGVILWGGRVYKDFDMSGAQLPVMNIYGTLDDKNENLKEINQPYLPENITIAWIPGGNRTNFANFGPLSRDVGAEIPREEQQRQAVDYSIQYMKQNLP